MPIAGHSQRKSSKSESHAETRSTFVLSTTAVATKLPTVEGMEKGQAVEKDKQTESLYSAFCQRTSKMGENGKAERSEPI